MCSIRWEQVIGYGVRLTSSPDSLGPTPGSVPLNGAGARPGALPRAASTHDSTALVYGSVREGRATPDSTPVPSSTGH